MQEFEEALEGRTIRDLKGIGQNDQKVYADNKQLLLYEISKKIKVYVQTVFDCNFMLNGNRGKAAP
jgi:hypothetical protein